MKSLSILSWSIIVVFMTMIGILLTGTASLIPASEEQQLSAREDARDAAMMKIFAEYKTK